MPRPEERRSWVQSQLYPHCQRFFFCAIRPGAFFCQTADKTAVQSHGRIVIVIVIGGGGGGGWGGDPPPPLYPPLLCTKPCHLGPVKVRAIFGRINFVRGLLHVYFAEVLRGLKSRVRGTDRRTQRREVCWGTLGQAVHQFADGLRQ